MSCPFNASLLVPIKEQWNVHHSVTRHACYVNTISVSNVLVCWLQFIEKKIDFTESETLELEIFY